MKLVYLETAQPGLQWFRQYYRDHPELNWEAALSAFRAAVATTKAHPWSGPVFDDIDGVFVRQVGGTAFSLLHTIRDDTIYVIDVRDGRGHRSAAALRLFTSELRRKYELD